MSIQYDMSQAELTMKDVSHQYKDYFPSQNTFKEKDLIGHPDERLSLPSTKILSQRSAFHPNLSNFQSEQSPTSQYGPAGSQALGRNSITDIYSKHLDNSRTWNAEFLPGPLSDVNMPDQGTGEICGQNSYQYSESTHQKQPRQPMLRAESTTSIGITTLDPCIPPILVDRQLPIPTGGRMVGSTTSSEMAPSQPSTLLSHGFGGMHFDHNVAYSRASSIWANKSCLNNSHCNSSGSIISHNLTNSSLIGEGETCDDTEMSPMSCVSAQCTPEPCHSSSTHPVTTGASVPMSLARRELSRRTDTLASKHGVPPSLYSFSSEYLRQGPCLESSLGGSMNNQQKCSEMY